ncbi:hypothetical protein M406DRAFT_354924 [Cryphonectria parasitica EP155]|uniref:Uncharacterized protein n=1 Tax=Cryphonectria parasitica (strain ATCC 38755 / EP155) TaxID=660469 RepID=A0A9P5CSG5_CRYP1|nr:uncharacterized protein M406DRAFT_354924 [Cryphonectria parasitica EP155]KAF3768572.1 hypothetical protein M406DRAFT_354924 [Cryphonectria parasitica EP155]
MKACHLLSSLYLTPLVLAAPVVHTSVLIAGAATRTVVLRTGPVSHTSHFDGSSAHIIEDMDPKAPEDALSSSPPLSPSAALDSERPLTTAELMALSNPAPIMSTSPSKKGPEERPLATKGSALSVGALVAPGTQPGDQAQVHDMDNVKPFLVPGYYVSSQRADVLVVALILVFVLVVLAVETSSLVVGIVSKVFRCGKHRRSLEDKERGPVVVGLMMDCGLDGDDEGLAPFAGYRLRDEQRSLRLPEKLDEKAALV